MCVCVWPANKSFLFLQLSRTLHTPIDHPKRHLIRIVTLLSARALSFNYWLCVGCVCVCHLHAAFYFFFIRIHSWNIRAHLGITRFVSSRQKTKNIFHHLSYFFFSDWRCQCRLSRCIEAGGIPRLRGSGQIRRCSRGNIARRRFGQRGAARLLPVARVLRHSLSQLLLEVRANYIKKKNNIVNKKLIIIYSSLSRVANSAPPLIWWNITERERVAHIHEDAWIIKALWY